MTEATHRPTRRRFLASTAAAIAAPTIIPRTVLAQDGRPGANDRISIGVIGIGIRGKYQIANVPPAGRVTAVCDCYAPRMHFALQPETRSRYAALLARFRQEDASGCTAYQDYRELIDDRRIDAVLITACDHHHVQAAILACQAGKDVYVEKPLSVTIREGRALVDAAKRFDRVVQVGSQQRSMEMNQFACRFVREGGLGTVSHINLPNYAGSMAYRPMPEEAMPDGMNWELYCGPTPLRPYNLRLWAKEEFDGRRFAWRGWDMWRDYSGHLMSNHAAHSADMVQLALGKDDTGPVEVRLETEAFFGPMRMCPVTLQYADGMQLRFDRQSRGQVYHGDRGVLYLRRNGFRVHPAELITDAPDASVLDKWTGGGEHVSRPHIQNWLDCVVSRETPNAPLEAGHRTATICHLANLARELGRNLTWDPEAERFENDDQANGLLERPRRPGFELPQST